MELKIWLDKKGFFKLKVKGDPILVAEAISSLALQNKMFADILFVANKCVKQQLEKENVPST